MGRKELILSGLIATVVTLFSCWWLYHRVDDALSTISEYRVNSFPEASPFSEEDYKSGFPIRKNRSLFSSVPEHRQILGTKENAGADYAAWRTEEMLTGIERSLLCITADDYFDYAEGVDYSKEELEDPINALHQMENCTSELLDEAAINLVEACQYIADHPLILQEKEGIRRNLIVAFWYRERILNAANTTHGQMEAAHACSRNDYDLPEEDPLLQGYLDYCNQNQLNFRRTLIDSCAEAVSYLPCGNDLNAVAVRAYAQIFLSQEPSSQSITDILNSCPMYGPKEVFNLVKWMAGDPEQRSDYNEVLTKLLKEDY